MISVKIPAGVDSGQVLRLAGQGEAGTHGGPAGDLLFEIEVQSDKNFTREGLDIHCDLDVPVHVALLGGKVDVPTLRGSGALTVPAGTSSDRILRIRGQGIWQRDKKGDQLTRIVITVPKELSNEAQEAVKQYLTPDVRS